MTSLKKILCCFALIASVAVSQAHAWHGHGFGGHGFSHGFGGYGFSGHGYGFGLNHHSFSPSIYNPGWSSYSRASFYGSYGYGGLGYSSYSYRSCWPRASYSFSYSSYAPLYYTNYSYYTPTYYAPTYYAPVYYTPACYSTYVTPVIYSNAYSGFPSCSVTPSTSSSPVSTYAVQKPVTNAVPFRLASQPVQASQVPAGRYVLAQASSAALDSAPDDLIAAADAILAAGGYRQAAQAYAQIVLKHGNSDRLVTRRFIAQVANGDYEQAAVVVELAAANGNHINQSDVPQGDLKAALGDKNGLIAIRSESLAEKALQNSDDATPMLAVSHWLALSGDSERAELFKARAEQMKQVEVVGKLISKPTVAPRTAN